jgi:hypothetical protein
LNSDFLKYLIQQWQTKLVFTMTFYPQTNDQADKANSIIKRFLRAFSTNKQKSWDVLFVIAGFGYNSHSHQSTGISSFKVDIEYISRIPLDTLTTIGYINYLEVILISILLLIWYMFLRNSEVL